MAAISGKRPIGEYRTQSLKNVCITFANLKELKVSDEKYQGSKNMIEALKALDNFLTEHDTNTELMETLDGQQKRLVYEIFAINPTKEAIINLDTNIENKKLIINNLNKYMPVIDFSNQDFVKKILDQCIERMKNLGINLAAPPLDDFNYRLVYSDGYWDIQCEYYVSSLILIAYLKVLKFLEINK